MSRMRFVQVFAVLLAVVLTAGVLGGCRKDKQELNPNLGVTGPSTVPSGGDDFGAGEGLPNVDQDSLLFDPNSPSGLQPVYFNFDSSSLTPQAMATLRDNADKLSGAGDVIVQVAGHCDERGTQEYNLALGERRALAVREHLIQLGIPGSRLVTISYGEEFPAVDGNTEAAYSLNRRCEFNKAQTLR